MTQATTTTKCECCNGIQCGCCNDEEREFWGGCEFKLSNSDYFKAVGGGMTDDEYFA